MKQAILLSVPELNSLKRGRMVEVSVGGYVFLIGCERDPIHEKREKSLRKARAARATKNGRRKK